MDICKSIKETPVYKLKLWKDDKETTTYMFVGKKGHNLKSVFDKLEKDDLLNTEEKEQIAEIYGSNYSKKLSLINFIEVVLLIKLFLFVVLLLLIVLASCGGFVVVWFRLVFV